LHRASVDGDAVALRPFVARLAMPREALVEEGQKQ
jgi:hypothetical protein|tara:strand:- start:1416 stop:1520 length:105 start_codon:yes stop_codon:yes gene_type:complete